MHERGAIKVYVSVWSLLMTSFAAIWCASRASQHRRARNSSVRHGRKGPGQRHQPRGCSVFFCLDACACAVWLRGAVHSKVDRAPATLASPARAHGTRAVGVLDACAHARNVHAPWVCHAPCSKWPRWSDSPRRRRLLAGGTVGAWVQGLHEQQLACTFATRRGHRRRARRARAAAAAGAQGQRTPNLLLEAGAGAHTQTSRRRPHRRKPRPWPRGESRRRSSTPCMCARVHA